MKTAHHIYISLGSNVGDKQHYLQKAVDQIYNTIGDVVTISALYQTPAWGFSSDDFYNVCIMIRSFYSTPVVLNKLLIIEDKLGRVRKKNDSYEARTIDLDIIYSSEGNFDRNDLTVPHPLVQDRRFVLEPLVEIAPDYLHPKLKLTTLELIAKTQDKTVVTKLKSKLDNPKRNYDLAALKYLSIEGNIGVGKTSLAKMLAKEFSANLVLETFDNNPFLPKFYEDAKRFALPVEMTFLTDRFEQLNAIYQSNAFDSNFYISDFAVMKSLVFAKANLTNEEFDLYYRLYKLINATVLQKQTQIYLHQDVTKLLENIHNRGRSYEQNIKEVYLKKIEQHYRSFIKENPELAITIIDVTDKDFIANREDYISILNEIIL